jgi:SAM-dependent methyltransferase
MSGLLCRLCGAPLTRSFVDLGRMPLANSYLTEAALARPEPAYPLHARFCDACFLVQVEDVVPREAIFSDYAYFSSYSSAWIEHGRRYAEAMQARFALGPRSEIIEVASNDGYLLQHFAAAGLPVLGIEPAANVAAIARDKGIPTEVAFFGRATAERLRAEGHAAELMAANNVLAHVPDVADFVAGFRILLRPQGVATFEFPHLLTLIAESQFDTIYHEHFSYFSLLAAERLMRRHDLAVFDVERLPTHGGSLRLFVARVEAKRREEPGLLAVRAAEAAAGLDKPAAYDGFQVKAEAVRDALLRFLDEAKREGRTVAAYGAAAKGNTLLNFARVGTERIAFVADRSPHKQGRYLPGSHLPILAPEHIFATRPDYVLILPWNIRHEIVGELAGVADWGGRFVTAVPTLRVFAPVAV